MKSDGITFLGYYVITKLLSNASEQNEALYFVVSLLCYFSFLDCSAVGSPEILFFLSRVPPNTHKYDRYKFIQGVYII